MNSRPGEGLPSFFVDLKPSDVLIVATDGLWDNLTVAQILQASWQVDKEHPAGQEGFCKSLLESLMRSITSDWRKYDDVTMVAVQV